MACQAAFRTTNGGSEGRWHRASSGPGASPIRLTEGPRRTRSRRSIAICTLPACSTRPDWFTESCNPSPNNPVDLVTGRQGFEAEHFLWGDTPAIGVLELAENDGQRFHELLSLLFADERFFFSFVQRF